MQQDNEGHQGRLPVLAAKRNDEQRGRRVVQLAKLGTLPLPQLHRLAYALPFGNAAVSLDPPDVPLASGHPSITSTCQGLLGPPPLRSSEERRVRTGRAPRMCAQ